MQPDLLEYGNDYLAFIRRHPPFGSATELIAAYQRELEQRRQEQVSATVGVKPATQCPGSPIRRDR